MKFTPLATILLLLLAGTLLPVELLCNQPSSAVNSSKKVWLLEQDTDQLGPMKVYLTQDGLRAESIKSGMVIIAHPPDWDVVSFLPAVKKYAVCKRSKFRGPSINQLAIITRGDISAVPIVLKGHTTVCGVKAAEYETTKSFGEEQSRRFERHDIHPSSVKHAIYQVGESFGLPAPEGEILQRFFGLPVVNGVPLAFSFLRVNSGTIDLLSIRTCRLKSVPASLFSLPSGFARTTSMEALLAQSASGQGGIGLIMQQMDSKEGFWLMDQKK